MKKVSENDKQFLINNYNKLSTKEICYILKRSRYSIYKIASSIGLKRRIIIDEKTLRLEYFINNKSIHEIAKIYNVSDGTIYARLKEFNINLKPIVEPTGNKGKGWKGYEEISSTYLSSVKNSARYRDIKFNINIEYMWDLFLNQDRKCALSGIDLNFGSVARCNDITASLDRIDSSKGYIEENVQWIHKNINFMKQDFNEKYFIEMCNLVTKNMINKNKIKLEPFIDILYINKKYSASKCRAKKKKIEFDLDRNYLIDLLDKQIYRCNLSGIDLRYNKVISIDRINSNKGYTKNNIQLVHKDINFMKQEYSQSEFINWCKLIYSHNLNKKV